MQRATLSAFTCVLFVQACTSSPAPAFSWYHSEGGEHLFAYDSAACEEQVLAQGQQLGSDTDGPYFHCMRALGYVLVDRTLLSVPRGLENSTAETSAER